MPDTGAHTVVAGVASAHNHHTLSPGRWIVAILQSRIEQAPGGLFQKVYGEPDTCCLPARDGQIPGVGSATAQYNRIILPHELLRIQIPANVHPSLKYNPLCSHQIQPALHNGFFQLHVGDPIHEQAARPILPFKYGDRMPPSAELICTGQPRRAGSHHCHTLSRTILWYMWSDQSALPGILNDTKFVLLDGHRISGESTGTGCLTQRGAHPSRELRKIVGFQQPFQRMPKITGINQVIPLRHQIVQRAAGHHAAQHRAGLTEGHAALHTARALASALFPAQVGMKFAIVLDAFQRCLGGVSLTLVFQKSSRFSHTLLPHFSGVDIERLHLRLLPCHALFFILCNRAEHPIIVMRQNLFEQRQIGLKMLQNLLRLG